MVILDFSDWHRRWPKDFLAETRAEIASGGVRIVHIDESSTITYTVGLTANYGFPEVAVTGFDSEQAQEKLLRKLVQQIRSNGHIPFDQEFLLLKRRAVLKIVENAENRKVASLAHALYKGKFELAQCVFSDSNGLYPWSLTGGSAKTTCCRSFACTELSSAAQIGERSGSRVHAPRSTVQKRRYNR